MTTAPAQPTCAPWHASDGPCNRRATSRSEPTIHRVTADIERDRRFRQRDAHERSRLRHLVDRLDSLILACERAHLRNLRETPPSLSAVCGAVLDDAVSLIEMTGSEEAAQIVRAQTIRLRARITDVMDMVWVTQDVVFDLLIPGRSELPDDPQAPSLPTAPAWQGSAA